MQINYNGLPLKIFKTALKKQNSVSREMIQWLRRYIALKRPQIQLLAPTLGNSQPPVAPEPGSNTLFWSSHTLTHTDTHKT